MTEQIEIYLMSLTRDTGSGLGIDRMDVHQSSEPLYVLAVNPIVIPTVHVVTQAPDSHPRMLDMKLI